jgi:hypothetical protein
MFLKNRSLLVKIVKTPAKHDAIKIDGDEKPVMSVDQLFDDIEHVRDMVVETVATVAVIAAGYKLVDTACKIAVNLSARGLIR